MKMKGKPRKEKITSVVLGVAIVLGSLIFGFSLMLNEGTSKSGKIPATEATIYEELEEAKDNGMLLLVNKNNPVLDEYVPSDLEAIKYYADDRLASARFMKKEAADQFHAMAEAAKIVGYDIVMTTAYRDYDFQAALYNDYISEYGIDEASKFIAKPGESEHQTGLAVDITSPTINNALSHEFGETDEGKWLIENCKDFGFVLRYMEDKTPMTGYNYEPWHFRYTGKVAAEIIYEQKLTLEEFLSKLKDKTLL